jgi:hypothetical protein
MNLGLRSVLTNDPSQKAEDILLPLYVDLRD